MNKSVVACLFALGCSKKKDEPPPPPPQAPPPAQDSGAAPPPSPPGPDQSVVQRGAYLVKAAGCLVCHTALGPHGPDLANLGAGGLEVKDKRGTWRSPNITPDKSSGIGSWTDDQIVAAIREGLRPDGKQMQAVMPYLSYNALTDDDAKALVVYLRTLKPIDRTVAKSDDLKMPLLQIPKPPNKKPADDPIEQGAYMASVMICSHCHFTPGKGFAGPGKSFSGGMPIEMPPLGTGTIYGANITSDPDTGIGKYSEDQIAAAIRMMQKADGKMIQGPMLLFQAGWSQLEDKDIKNVAAFIKKLPPVKNKVPPSTFKSTRAAGGPPTAATGVGRTGGGSNPAGSGSGH